MFTKQRKYIVLYTTKSLAHIEAHKMETLVQALIVICFVVYLVLG